MDGKGRGGGGVPGVPRPGSDSKKATRKWEVGPLYSRTLRAAGRGRRSRRQGRKKKKKKKNGWARAAAAKKQRAVIGGDNPWVSLEREPLVAKCPLWLIVIRLPFHSITR